MGITQASSPVNKQTTAIGVVIRRVIVEQIVPERGVAIVRDAHQYLTEIPYRVQAGRGRVPREGDYWYVDRSMGSWTFLAYIAKNDSDMTTYTEAMNFDEAVTINGPLFMNNEAYSTAALGVTRNSIYDTVYYVGIDGEPFDRFRFTAEGYHAWGPGNVAMDTNFYRFGPNHLKTDGDLTVSGHLHISDLVINGDLEVTDNFIVDGTTDLHHLTVSAGATINNGATLNGGTTINDGFTVNTGATVNGNLNVTGDINANDIDASGTLDVTNIITNSLTATGVITPNSGITLPNGAWIKRGNLTGMTMQNGWSYHGLGFQNPSYTEFPDRTAGLFGVADAGTTTGGTTISTIPAAIRPASDHVFLCAGDGVKTIQIVVQAGGAVKIQNASAAPAWVSLGNCRWPMAGF